jgi:Protein of unknown function (DUF3309)
MNVGLILPVILVVAAVFTLPAWRHSRRWGYYPSGILIAVVAVLLGLWALGRA